jgi:hypothetical protein
MPAPAAAPAVPAPAPMPKRYGLCPLVEGVNVFLEVEGTRVTGLVLSSVLEERFDARPNPDGWLDAYAAHAKEIDAAVMAAYEAAPSPVVILWPFDFPRSSA